MAIQFRVPQNIDLQDKIIGPLTMIQFLYLLAGGIADYLLYMFFKGNLVFWLLGLPIAIIALGLAFLKIQDQPLSHFIAAGLVYYSRPKERIWQRQGVEFTAVKETHLKKKEPPKITKQGVNRSELEKLAYTLDTHSQPEVEK